MHNHSRGLARLEAKLSHETLQLMVIVHRSVEPGLILQFIRVLQALTPYQAVCVVCDATGQQYVLKLTGDLSGLGEEQRKRVLQRVRCKQDSPVPSCC
jgi:hypothetical protein